MIGSLGAPESPESGGPVPALIILSLTLAPQARPPATTGDRGLAYNTNTKSFATMTAPTLGTDPSLNRLWHCQGAATATALALMVDCSASERIVAKHSAGIGLAILRDTGMLPAHKPAKNEHVRGIVVAATVPGQAELASLRVDYADINKAILIVWPSEQAQEISVAVLTACLFKADAVGPPLSRYVALDREFGPATEEKIF